VDCSSSMLVCACVRRARKTPSELPPTHTHKLSSSESRPTVTQQTRAEAAAVLPDQDRELPAESAAQLQTKTSSSNLCCSPLKQGTTPPRDSIVLKTHSS
jgi:hypothetical protein